MRLCAGLVVLCACHHATPQGVGSAAGDAGVDGKGDPAGPPVLAAASTPSWLHEDIHLAFDKPLTAADVTATATLAGAPIAATVTVAGAELVVALDPGARGTGLLAVHVEGDVTAGNGKHANVTTDVAATLGPWAAVTPVSGTAGPALAVGGDGRVVAAAGGTVAVLDHGAWTALDALPAAPSVVFDAQGRVVAAWSDGTTAHAARWLDSAWRELPSPGAGAAVALADAGGTPIIAVFGSAASVSALGADDTWQPLAASIPCAAIGEPLLAAAAPDRVAIGWVDAGSALHVETLAAGTWTALPAIGGVASASLAARENAIAIANDQPAGSHTVLAALANGDAWLPLGHALDAGPGDDAVAPAIALDVTGAPIVAWAEQFGTRERGVIARWDAGAWTLAAAASWLPPRVTTVAGTRLVLSTGDAPIVAAVTGGALALALYDGPTATAPGRAPIAGCALDPTNPAPLLSQTGCFTVGREPVPHPGLIPYGVVVELWTDGARKRRWLALPDGGALAVTANGSFTAPPGAMVIKEFAIETTPDNPTTRRPVETRFLVNDPAAGWRGFTYKWLPDASDATLEPDAEDTYAFAMDDGSTHTHFYPSRADCLTCHQSSNGPLLGLRGTQLARWMDYGGVIADQPATLVQLGAAPAITDAPLASPHDPSQTFERRTRGYMAANCAHCHNPSDVAVHDLRWETPLADTNLCPDISPGDPGGSRVYQLVSSRPGMPPLGTLEVDPIMVTILGAWIAGMASCP